MPTRTIITIVTGAIITGTIPVTGPEIPMSVAIIEIGMGGLILPQIGTAESVIAITGPTGIGTAADTMMTKQGF